MKNKTTDIFNNLYIRYPALSECKESILKAYSILRNTYERGGKVLVCGNGGSAADCEHIAGELMKGFLLERHLTDDEKSAFGNSPEERYIADNLQRALPAISLVSQSGLMTAFINDVDSALMYSQQVYGYMQGKDVLIAISTSGNSENILNAAITAKALKGNVIAFTGKTGGKLKKLSDAAICLPSSITTEIQEYTLPVYHALCAALENDFFS